MGRKPECGHSFVSNPGLDLPMAKPVTEEPPRLGFPRPYQDTSEVYEAYLAEVEAYNTRNGTNLVPLSNPWFNMMWDGVSPIPAPPLPIMAGWETREDAFERYLLALAEHNAKYGTAFEPVTDCWD